MPTTSSAFDPWGILGGTAQNPYMSGTMGMQSPPQTAFDPGALVAPPSIQDLYPSGTGPGSAADTSGGMGGFGGLGMIGMAANQIIPAMFGGGAAPPPPGAPPDIQPQAAPAGPPPPGAPGWDAGMSGDTSGGTATGQATPGINYGPALLPGDSNGLMPGNTSSSGSSSGGNSPYWISGGYDPWGGGGLTPEQMAYLNSGAGVDPSNPYNMGYAGARPGNNPMGGMGGGGLGGGALGGGSGGGILGSMYGAAASMYGSAQQAAANELASQLGLQGSLANTAAQKQLGLAGIANQIPAINAQNAPAMTKINLLKDWMQPGGILGGLVGSISGNLTGQNGQGQNGAPPLPSTHFIDPELLNQGLANISNQNATRFATLNNAIRQTGASNGFNTTNNAPGSANGVPAEIASENAMRQGMMNQANQRDWTLGMAQNNAQQANTVGQMAQNQYNANQNRILDRLRMALGFVGGMAGGLA